MNKKFSLFFVLILINTPWPQMQAMATLTKSPFFLSIATKNLAKNFGTPLSRNYSHNQDSKSSLGIIDSFDEQQDTLSIQQITFDHHQSLVNPFFLNDERDVWADDVMPALHDKKIISKVYRLNGTAVGFVNYFIYEPWYKKTIPYLKEIGPTCNIIHIAVSNKYHNQGIGSDLLQSVIDDCHTKSVNKITLCTVGRIHKKNVFHFYEKFGFKIYKAPLEGTTGDTGWSKRLGPSPFFVIALKIIEFLEEIDEW